MTGVKGEGYFWRCLFENAQFAKPLVLSDARPCGDLCNWTPKALTDRCPRLKLQARVSKTKCQGTQWEVLCRKELLSVGELIGFSSGQSEEIAYADYVHLCSVEDDSFDPDLLKMIDWSELGYPGRTAKQSTIWLGSSGAHTPLHYDAFGHNLVAQLYGMKTWVLFPPEDEKFLYPTRVPFEESSIYSQANLLQPSHSFPLMKQCHPFVCHLKPGQVLYVPNRWWHFVVSQDFTVSVNTWIDPVIDFDRAELISSTEIIKEQNKSHMKEALVKYIAEQLIPSEWCNQPKDSITLHELAKIKEFFKDRLEKEELMPVDIKKSRFDCPVESEIAARKGHVLAEGCMDAVFNQIKSMFPLLSEPAEGSLQMPQPPAILLSLANSVLSDRVMEEITTKFLQT